MIYLKKGRCCQACSEKGAGLSCCVFVPVLGAPMDKTNQISSPYLGAARIGTIPYKVTRAFFYFYVFEHFSAEFSYRLFINLLYIY